MVLRRQGKSLREIAKELDVSQSTASFWVHHVALGERARKRLQQLGIHGRIKGVLTNQKKRLAVIKERTDAMKQVVARTSLTRQSARIYCALLHWCEGSKDTGCVYFTNSDPVMIATFLSLLRKGFGIDESKFRVCMHIHGYHDERIQKRFWSHATRIPEHQFIKTFHKKNTGKSLKEGYQGCVSIRYYDALVAMELQILWQLFGKKYGRVG